jgi:hypothetical protein
VPKLQGLQGLVTGIRRLGACGKGEQSPARCTEKSCTWRRREKKEAGCEKAVGTCNSQKTQAHTVSTSIQYSALSTQRAPEIILTPPFTATTCRASNCSVCSVFSVVLHVRFVSGPSSVCHRPHSINLASRSARFIRVRCTDGTVEHRWFARSFRLSQDQRSSVAQSPDSIFFFCSPPRKSRPHPSTQPSTNYLDRHLLNCKLTSFSQPLCCTPVN